MTEIEEARHVARCLWDFISEWDGMSELRSDLAESPVGTPEFELYVKAVIADEIGRETDWLKMEERPE